MGRAAPAATLARTPLTAKPKGEGGEAAHYDPPLGVPSGDMFLVAFPQVKRYKHIVKISSGRARCNIALVNHL